MLYSIELMSFKKAKVMLHLLLVFAYSCIMKHFTDVGPGSFSSGSTALLVHSMHHSRLKNHSESAKGVPFSPLTQWQRVVQLGFLFFRKFTES